MDLENLLLGRAKTYKRLAGDSVQPLADFIRSVLAAVRSGSTLFMAGNGGSAAECQHFAAELVVRYRDNRRALPAVALSTDTSVLTACGNDFSFADVFARQIEALGRRGDSLLLLSTSGNSENLIRASSAATKLGMGVFGLLGRDGGAVAPLCQSVFIVPAEDTAIIQEVHLAVIHIICDSIDVWAAETDQR